MRTREVAGGANKHVKRQNGHGGGVVMYRSGPYQAREGCYNTLILRFWTLPRWGSRAALAMVHPELTESTDSSRDGWRD